MTLFFFFCGGALIKGAKCIGGTQKSKNQKFLWCFYSDWREKWSTWGAVLQQFPLHATSSAVTDVTFSQKNQQLYAAFRLAYHLPHCRFDDDICTTAQAPLATEG